MDKVRGKPPPDKGDALIAELRELLGPALTQNMHPYVEKWLRLLCSEEAKQEWLVALDPHREPLPTTKEFEGKQDEYYRTDPLENDTKPYVWEAAEALNLYGRSGVNALPEHVRGAFFQRSKEDAWDTLVVHMMAGIQYGYALFSELGIMGLESIQRHSEVDSEIKTKLIGQGRDEDTGLCFLTISDGMMNLLLHALMYRETLVHRYFEKDMPPENVVAALAVEEQVHAALRQISPEKYQDCKGWTAEEYRRGIDTSASTTNSRGGK